MVVSVQFHLQIPRLDVVDEDRAILAACCQHGFVPAAVVAPPNREHRTLASFVQLQLVGIFLWRPNVNRGLAGGAAGEQTSVRVPLDLLDHVLVTLPLNEGLAGPFN